MKSDVKLTLPSEEYLKSYYEMCVEYKEKCVKIRSLHDPGKFDEWRHTLIPMYRDAREGRNLPEGFVPYTAFWLVEGGEVVGLCNLRHRLTDGLMMEGGHIGYCIRWSKWNQGYGTLQLKLILSEAAKMGIVRALVTCNDDNLGSARVIEKNGGVLEDVVTVQENGRPKKVRRYRVDTPAARNCYMGTADLYDFNNMPIITEDIPFYLEYAAACGGEVLELACGTGRVALPIAEAGHLVTGLDLSAPMLDRFRHKLEKASPEVRERVTLVHENMARFHLGERFSLIIIPYRAFQGLTEREDALDCLRRARENLTDDGVFIVDAFRPRGVLDKSWCYPELVQWERRDDGNNRSIVKKTRGDEIDVERQIIYPTFIYGIMNDDGTTERREERLALKYYYCEQLRSLLRESGLVIREEYGWYDKSPVENGRELLFVCGKS